MSELGNVEITDAQGVLHTIKVIIEIESANDASGLLANDGWYLLGVANTIFEDSEWRFVYSLGCTRSRKEWDNWEQNF